MVRYLGLCQLALTKHSAITDFPAWNESFRFERLNKHFRAPLENWRTNLVLIPLLKFLQLAICQPSRPRLEAKECCAHFFFKETFKYKNIKNNFFVKEFLRTTDCWQLLKNSEEHEKTNKQSTFSPIFRPEALSTSFSWLSGARPQQ